jgi:CTD small phosphatase-like protein 2
LSKLGRSLEKTVIVDNVADNYKYQADNGLNISNFEGDENDTELDHLLQDLYEMFNSHPNDVREYLPNIREKMKKRYQISTTEAKDKVIIPSINEGDF